MSKHYRYLFTRLTLAILSAGVLVYALRKAAGAGLFPEPDRKLDQYSSIDQPPKIHPNYYGVVIPPNIAPLNFSIQQDGSHYFARIYS